MTRLFSLALLYFLIAAVTFAQFTPGLHPYGVQPSIGWDSLQARIQFPWIERVSRLNGAATVHVTFDSLGGIKQLDVQATSHDVASAIHDALEGIKWIPIRNNGSPMKSGWIMFQVFFVLKGSPSLSTLTISATPERMDTDSVDAWIKRKKTEPKKQ